MKLFNYSQVTIEDKIKFFEIVAKVLFVAVITLLLFCSGLLIYINILTNGEF
jgi:hypothetical protein